MAGARGGVGGAAMNGRRTDVGINARHANGRLATPAFQGPVPCPGLSRPGVDDTLANGGGRDDKTQTALITGASRGLGLALARELARREWSLLIDARGAEALVAARAELSGATRMIALAGDVTDAAHRDGLAAAARELGGLDAVINNASTLGVSPLPPLLDYPIAALEAVFRANVIAPLALLQAVRDQLKPGARILNITSDAGVEAYPGWGGYGASKAALEQLSHVLAAERPDLRVYWVDPGDMRTQMHQEAFPGEDISDRPLPEESVPGLMELLTGSLPSGRYQARALPPPATPDRGQRRREGDAGRADGRGLRPGAGLLPRWAWPAHRHRLDSRRDGAQRRAGGWPRDHRAARRGRRRVYRRGGGGRARRWPGAAGAGGGERRARVGESPGARSGGAARAGPYLLGPSHPAAARAGWHAAIALPARPGRAGRSGK